MYLSFRNGYGAGRVPAGKILAFKEAWAGGCMTDGYVRGTLLDDGMVSLDICSALCIM